MRSSILVLSLICLLAAPPAWAEDPAPEAFKPLFDALQTAANAGDRKAVGKLFDAQRTVQEVSASGFFDALPKPVRARVESGLVMGIPMALVTHDLVDGYASYEIRSVKAAAAEGEFLVYVRHRDEDGYVSKIRWSIAKRGDAYRIYDYEDLELGMSFTSQLASGSLTTLKGAEHLTEAVAAVMTARRMGLEGNTQGAIELLRTIEDGVLPKALEVGRLMMTGAFLIDLGKTQDGLAELAKVRDLKPGIPIVQYLEAIGFNDLEDHAKALTRTQSYVRELGGDGPIWVEMARAYLGRGQRDECLATLARSLEEDPNYAESIAWLGMALPAIRLSEAVDRMLRLPRLESDFEALAETVLERGEALPLQAFATAFASRYPEHPDGYYYRGHAFDLQDGKKAEAAAAYERGMVLAEGLDNAEAYSAQYFGAMLELGRSTEAFAKAPDKEYALEYLGWDLADGGNAEPLRKLATAAANTFSPTYPKVVYFLAEADFIESKYAEVVKRLSPVVAEWRAQDVDEGTLEILWESEDRILRSHLRLEQFEAVMKLARAIYVKDEDSRYLVIAYAAAGKHEQANTALKECLESGDYDPFALFEDEDVGAILRKNDTYKALREAHYR